MYCFVFSLLFVFLSVSGRRFFLFLFWSIFWNSSRRCWIDTHTQNTSMCMCAAAVESFCYASHQICASYAIECSDFMNKKKTNNKKIIRQTVNAIARLPLTKSKQNKLLCPPHTNTSVQFGIKSSHIRHTRQQFWTQNKWTATPTPTEWCNLTARCHESATPTKRMCRSSSIGCPRQHISAVCERYAFFIYFAQTICVIVHRFLLTVHAQYSFYGFSFLSINLSVGVCSCEMRRSNKEKKSDININSKRMFGANLW